MPGDGAGERAIDVRLLGIADRLIVVLPESSACVTVIERGTYWTIGVEVRSANPR